jgi:two-component system, cell cycle response regulator DivK
MCDDFRYIVKNIRPMQQPIILVVDDDEPQRRLLYDVLSASGYRVLLADSGTCGLAMACQERPDLILLDIRLPDISGREVAGVLKATPETSSIPIAAITALAMPGDERAIRESGCDAYMAKPVRMEQLLKLVARLLQMGDYDQIADSETT